MLIHIKASLIKLRTIFSLLRRYVLVVKMTGRSGMSSIILRMYNLSTVFCEMLPIFLRNHKWFSMSKRGLRLWQIIVTLAVINILGCIIVNLLALFQRFNYNIIEFLFSIKLRGDLSGFIDSGGYIKFSNCCLAILLS